MNAHARLPAEPQARKNVPIATGVVDYFPDALAAVAELSKKGNDQHNPGQPLHWDRAKSTDEADALMRHFLDRGSLDIDGIRHSAKVAWRALALLQKEIEVEAARLTEVRGADFVFCAAAEHPDRDPNTGLMPNKFYAPTPQQAADDALAQWRAETREDARSTAIKEAGHYLEYKFGFIEGETVYSCDRVRAGTVVGFEDDFVHVRWFGETCAVQEVPDDLRHGP